MKNYIDDFKSLLIGQKYSVKNDPSIVFVFKSDRKIYDKYKEHIGKKEKKEKRNNKINAPENVLIKNEIVENEQNIKNNEIERNVYNPYSDPLKNKTEIFVGELAVKPLVEIGIGIIDNEIPNDEFIGAKKKNYDKIAEEKKKMKDELSKLNPMNTLRDPKLILDKDGLNGVVDKALDVGNFGGHLNNNAEKSNNIPTSLAGVGNTQDIKLNVGQELKKVGDSLNDGMGQALEKLEKEKEQMIAGLEKAKGQLTSLIDPKNLNIKAMFTLNNLIGCAKSCLGQLNQPKELSERQKILANLIFICNVFAEMVCIRYKIG